MLLFHNLPGHFCNDICLHFSAPSAAPTITEIRKLTPRSIKVHFTPPPMEDWNSETLRGYKVRYGISSALRMLDVDVNTLSVEIDSLIEGKE